MTALGLRPAGRLGLSPRRQGLSRPFSPSSLAGLEFWYDATDSPVIAAGGVVERWDDLSGNSNHCGQVTAGQRPLKTTDGGRDVIRFDGIDDALLVSAPPTFANGVTVFAIFAMRTRIDFTGIVSVAAATGVDHGTFFTLQNASAASGLFRWLGRSTEANTLLIQRPDPGAMAMAVLSGHAGTATYRDLAGEVADTYGGSFSAPAQIVLGGRYNGATFGYAPVDFYEIGLYSRALTGGEKSQLADYLIARYGL